MLGEKAQKDDYGKAGTLVALGNIVLAPLYWVDGRLGLSAAIIGTAALLYGAHEVGKKRRPVGNAVNNANSFFAPKTGDKSTEMQNMIDNIAIGGAAIFDELIPENKPKKQ